jgi:cell division inhibitor SepF
MGFLSKLKDIVGFDNQNNRNNEYEDVEQHTRHKASGINSSTNVSASRFVLNSDVVTSFDIDNVIDMSRASNATSSVVMIEPRAFEEMPLVIDALRQQKSVILNMALVRQEEAQRAVDFVAGGTYAIDGHYERLGDKIFLFTPSCVQVTTSNNVFNEIVQVPVRPPITPEIAYANRVIVQ